MLLRPLTVIALMLAASPVAAEDSAIRLFAPAPNGPSPTRQASSQQEGAIRLFSPVSSSSRSEAPPAAPLPMVGQSEAPAIRGAMRETDPAQALPADRAWVVAPR